MPDDGICINCLNRISLYAVSLLLCDYCTMPHFHFLGFQHYSCYEWLLRRQKETTSVLKQKIFNLAVAPIKPNLGASAHFL